jgi:hypothetical protein
MSSDIVEETPFLPLVASGRFLAILYIPWPTAVWLQSAYIVTWHYSYVSLSLYNYLLLRKEV